MKNKNLVSFLLRVGLASVFMYVGIAVFLDPMAWIGFFPIFLRDMFAENLMLYGHAVFDLVLAFWLLTGYRPRISGMLATAALLGIVIFNLGALDVIFRDVAVMFAALALVVLES